MSDIATSRCGENVKISLKTPYSNCLTFLLTGRDNEIATLVNYLMNPHNNEFFTVYGESGSGKTCLISKLLLEVCQII